ncbi:hypothetical protein K4A83_21285 [Spirulina subsalsa FACHB-351]|uniref:HEPN domain-containing protein n=1 Tax=Spirulina subsalsa FACHB-351 TaxID=234711 RepID=A0ABT3LB97_9CYAN|nr:hypothetical protein [Spirulina subsalsa]MCW6038783.1 hypothetical protein [Spirulina subsalsa FACHB-351]
MTDCQLRLLVHYRLKEAEETLREAEILLEQSAFRGSVNRWYYAMFYGEMLIPDQELAANLLAQARVFFGEIKMQLAKVGFDLEGIT